MARVTPEDFGLDIGPPMFGPRRPEEIGAEALGFERHKFSQRLSLTNWNSARFAKEMQTEGWEARFAADVAQGQRREDAEIVNRLCRGVLADKGLSSVSARPTKELLDLINAPRLRALATGYDMERDGGRLVLGPTGIGKSIAAAIVVRRRAERSVLEDHKAEELQGGTGWWRHPSARVVWVRAVDLPNARLGHELGTGEAPLVVAVVEAPAAIIDDLGWESRRAGADDVLPEVIARRYDVGLPTFVTSGLTLEQFRERYSDAIVRRITESGGKPGKVVDLWQKQALKAV